MLHAAFGRMFLFTYRQHRAEFSQLMAGAEDGTPFRDRGERRDVSFMGLRDRSAAACSRGMESDGEENADDLRSTHCGDQIDDIVDYLAKTYGAEQPALQERKPHPSARHGRTATFHQG